MLHVAMILSLTAMVTQVLIISKKAKKESLKGRVWGPVNTINSKSKSVEWTQQKRKK